MISRTYQLHDIPVTFRAEDMGLIARLDRYWRIFRTSEAAGDGLHIQLQIEADAPAPPAGPPLSIGPDVSYYRQGERLSIYFPGWGRFDTVLGGNESSGRVARSAVDNDGVMEDMILIALAPLLRRRGYYTIHAFAAAVGDRALLILGDSGAGKTTTGLSLLTRGARLLANDAPLLHVNREGQLRLHAYPGLISAYPDSIARFPQLEGLLADHQPDERGKIAFAVEDVWPDGWAGQAQPAALVFPGITPDLTRSYLEPMTAFGALQRLIGQSIEDWDAATIPAQLRMLRQLVGAAPSYYLHLAPDIDRLPDLLLPLVG
jgi:hypothetical protein